MIIWKVTYYEEVEGPNCFPRIWCVTGKDAKRVAGEMVDIGYEKRLVTIEKIELPPEMTATPRKALCKILNYYGR